MSTKQIQVQMFRLPDAKTCTDGLKLTDSKTVKQKQHRTETSSRQLADANISTNEQIQAQNVK